jgi:hypothetical protein
MDNLSEFAQGGINGANDRRGEDQCVGPGLPPPEDLPDEPNRAYDGSSHHRRVRSDQRGVDGIVGFRIIIRIIG